MIIQQLHQECVSSGSSSSTNTSEAAKDSSKMKSISQRQNNLLGLHMPTCTKRMDEHF